MNKMRVDGVVADAVRESWPSCAENGPLSAASDIHCLLQSLRDRPCTACSCCTAGRQRPVQSPEICGRDINTRGLVRYSARGRGFSDGNQARLLLSARTMDVRLSPVSKHQQPAKMRPFSSGMTTARVMMKAAASKDGTHIRGEAICAHISRQLRLRKCACSFGNINNQTAAVCMSHTQCCRSSCSPPRSAPCLILRAGLDDEADDEPEHAAHKNRQELQQRTRNSAR